MSAIVGHYGYNDRHSLVQRYLGMAQTQVMHDPKRCHAAATDDVLSLPQTMHQYRLQVFSIVSGRLR